METRTIFGTLCVPKEDVKEDLTEYNGHNFGEVVFLGLEKLRRSIVEVLMDWEDDMATKETKGQGKEDPKISSVSLFVSLHLDLSC